MNPNAWTKADDKLVSSNKDHVIIIHLEGTRVHVHPPTTDDNRETALSSFQIRRCSYYE